MITMNIVTIDQNEKAKILYRKTKPIDLETLDTKAMRELVKKMRTIMKHADGVGLSANQIGLDMQLFVAEIPQEAGQGRSKFYAILNPEIVKASSEATALDEGCLSIPRVYGPVERAEKVTLTGFDVRGKKLKIKAPKNFGLHYY